MLLFVYCYYFLLLPHFCLLTNPTGESANTANSVELFLLTQPEVDNSCYVRRRRAKESVDFYIICPTRETCYVKQWYPPQFQLFPIDDNKNFNGQCEVIEAGKQLPVQKADQLNSVLRVLRSSNETVRCSDDFSPVENLHVSNVIGLNLGQFGRSSNCTTNTSHEGNCRYGLKNLNIFFLNFETLLNKSFCQFRQLETLFMINCNLSRIEENALVYLRHLKGLSLNNNGLTYLPPNLFRDNDKLYYVNLSDNRLQLSGLRAFYSLRSLRLLRLSDNRLNSLNDSWTFPLNLEKLFVDGNQIRSVGAVGLDKLVNLTELDLRNNSVVEVEEKAFFSLKSLISINLEQNEIELLPNNTFESNWQLEQLNIRENRLREFPQIGHLYNLTSVRIGMNRISSISKNDLVNCSRLTYLDVSYNRLNFVEEGAFEHLRQLEILNLSHNRLSQKSSNFKRSFVSLKLDLDYNNFTAFSIQNFPPSLNQLSLRFNQIEIIEVFNFHGQGRWNLTSLDLSNNRLLSIQHLRLPPSIQYLNFSSNHIYQLTSFNRMVRQSLRTVDLRNNNITFLCESLLNIVRILDSDVYINYYLSLNPLKCSCDLLWITDLIHPATRFVDLDDIYCRDMSYFDELPGRDYLKPLKSLDKNQFKCLSTNEKSNRCECPQPPAVRCQVQLCPYNCTCLSDIQFNFIDFMCRNRGFRQIPTQFFYNDVYNHSFITFNFNMNFIPRVKPINFGHLGSQTIVLALQDSEVESIDARAFDKLIHLLILDLSYNRLQHLPPQLFSKLTQLYRLDLSHNQLTHVADNTFSSITELQYLFLHNNGLKQFELRGQIVNLQSFKNITLYNNPWSCECAYIKSFKTFLVNFSTIIHNYLELNCLENGEALNIVNFNMDHCSTQIHLTIIIVSLTIGLVIIITSGLVFKWRYELRVLVYARYGLRVFHRREEQVRGKQYDAFVAYNSNDELFLVNELLPGLEAIAKPYRLCIHHRDFPAGAVIQDSIMEAIDMSSRTIILLSDSFVRSGWCRFEFKNAHIKMLEDRCPRILVIVVGEVPTEALEPEMKLYLRTNTYLEWGEKLFWQKLYYAMPDKRVTAPATDIMPMREF